MFQKYASYLLLDFISDDFFIRSVKHPTPQTEAFWLEFLEVFPHQVETFRKAKQALNLLSLSSRQETNLDDYKEIWDNIQMELNEQVEPEIKPIYYKSWFGWVAAAILIFTISLTTWFYLQQEPTTNIYTYQVSAAKEEHELEEIINQTSSSVKLNLPDGSKVILAKNSRISYVKAFNDNKREVYLIGEAFFDVVKNPEKPFFVYTNHLTTKVLGTSFSIMGYAENRDVIVSVKSGKVTVYPNVVISNKKNFESNGIILVPNQQVHYVDEKEQLQRTLVEKPIAIIPLEKTKDFVFVDTPIKEIFERLSQLYGIKIAFDEQLLAKCRLTTHLETENLYEKLNIICAGIDASYKIVDAEIIIQSKGCE